MHIFQNDLALGESDELLANLGIGQSVQSIGLWPAMMQGIWSS